MFDKHLTAVQGMLAFQSTNNKTFRPEERCVRVSSSANVLLSAGIIQQHVNALRVCLFDFSCSGLQEHAGWHGFGWHGFGKR